MLTLIVYQGFDQYGSKVFREIWFSIKDFEWYENISLRNDGLIYKMLSFLSLISLVCYVFRNEEGIVFIAIIVFFPLSCCLDFQLIKLLSLKIFLLKRFFNWYGCLTFEFQSIKLLYLKTFLLKRFFNWYGCLTFEFQSIKLLYLKTFLFQP